MLFFQTIYICVFAVWSILSNWIYWFGLRREPLITFGGFKGSHMFLLQSLSGNDSNDGDDDDDDDDDADADADGGVVVMMMMVVMMMSIVRMMVMKTVELVIVMLVMLVMATPDDPKPSIRCFASHFLAWMSDSDVAPGVLWWQFILKHVDTHDVNDVNVDMNYVF